MRQIHKRNAQSGESPPSKLVKESQSTSTIDDDHAGQTNHFSGNVQNNGGSTLLGNSFVAGGPINIGKPFCF